MPANLSAIILAWLHIISVIGWMGFAMFFGMVMGPVFPQLSNESRKDLIIKLFPRLIRYAIIFSTLSLIFGILLYMELA